jgi:hypothetical protein
MVSHFNPARSFPDKVSVAKHLLTRSDRSERNLMPGRNGGFCCDCPSRNQQLLARREGHARNRNVVRGVKKNCGILLCGWTLNFV